MSAAVSLRPGALRDRRELAAGAAILGAMAAACLLVPLLAGPAPDEIVAAPLRPPSLEHPFGTDTVGRDLLVRTFAAGRLDLLLAALIVSASLAIGTVLGTIAGAARSRWVDGALMRLVDAVIAFPFLIAVVVLVVVLGPERGLGPLPAGAPAVVAGMIAVGWAFYARLARGQALALRDRDHVVAARVAGIAPERIVLAHVLPGVVGVVAAYAVADAVLTIIVVASLSFLGVGIQPPAAEWGSIMFEGRTVLEVAWWVTVLPGAVLALTGLGLSLMADALLAIRGGR